MTSEWVSTAIAAGALLVAVISYLAGRRAATASERSAAAAQRSAAASELSAHAAEGGLAQARLEFDERRAARLYLREVEYDLRRRVYRFTVVNAGGGPAHDLDLGEVVIDGEFISGPMRRVALLPGGEERVFRRDEPLGVLPRFRAEARGVTYKDAVGTHTVDLPWDAPQDPR